MAIGFPMRRSHQLIATPIAPLAAPVCRPRLVVSLGSPCVCSFLVLSLRSFHLVISPSRLALLPFLSSSRRCLPHSWRRIGSWGRQLVWRRDFLYAPFSSAHYRSPRHQVLIIGGGGGARSLWVRRGGLDGALSSSHPARLTRPHCHIISSRSGGVGVCRLSSKQRRHGGSSAHHLIPSSHPIPVMERLARHLVPCVSSGISSPYTGSSTGTGRTKQASEHAKPGRETGEQDGETDGTRTARQRETEERNEEDGKQSRGRGNGDMRQSRTRTKRPSFLFARPPRRKFSSVRRPQLVPRPPGVG